MCASVGTNPVFLVAEWLQGALEGRSCEDTDPQTHWQNLGRSFGSGGAPGTEQTRAGPPQCLLLQPGQGARTLAPAWGSV